tara:strand:- start:330 stop:518 length:189 start_codon:yes stop_codon:yes gene_type:complete
LATLFGKYVQFCLQIRKSAFISDVEDDIQLAVDLGLKSVCFVNLQVDLCGPVVYTPIPAVKS